MPSEEFTFKGQILSILRAFKNMKCGLLVKVSAEEKLGSTEFLKIHILIFFPEIPPLEIKITFRN